MSQTLTISDALYARLEQIAHARGCTNIDTNVPSDQQSAGSGAAVVAAAHSRLLSLRPRCSLGL
jgi:hypothetical protein